MTYVEQAVAAATADSYPALIKNLQAIRYKDGVIDYESRNHFLVSDWTRNNTWCRDVTAELGVSTDAITRTISKKVFLNE